jgi:hypothetical protein
MPVMEQEMAAKTVTLMLQHLADWPMRSTERFRNAMMGGTMVAINPLLGMNEEHEVEFLRDLMRRAVAEGRMIDFGFLPNELIKVESVRSRRMFEAGEFVHPYETWVAVTSWEGGFNGYFIAPHPSWQGAVLVIELYGLTMPGNVDAVMIYDMVSIKVEGVEDTRVSPTQMVHPDGKLFTESEAERRARGSNSLDPLVTMLRLLADASIPVIPKPAPDKLNKARAKHGKTPIPAHTHVNTKDYVAHFLQARHERHSAGQGHHASPMAHWRRAHLRTLASGRVVPVKSSKVNWRDNEELHRLFYKMDKK